MGLWIDAGQVPVRRLTYEDRAACMALAESREWGREDPKWRFLFDVAEVYGIEDPSGELIGCCTLTRYGTTSAAIGMVLVAKRYEGRGLGRRLMTHAMEQAGIAVVSLYATEMGRPLYEKLGFRITDRDVTHIGTFAGERPDGPATRPVTDADLPGVLAADLAAFGADRSDLLTTLFGAAEHFVVAEDGSGYAAAWRNTPTLVIGPVVADDVATARALIADIAMRDGGRVRVNALHAKAGLRGWLTEVGVAPANESSFMVVGGAALPGDHRRLWAPVTQAV